MTIPGPGTHPMVEYLSFLRGYAAAVNHDAADLASEPASYVEGFAAAAQPVEHTARYRELSVEHGPRGPESGTFRGNLTDLLR